MPIPVSALLGSPRRLVAAIVMFVALDLTVLLINLWIADQVARDAVAINLAGRQRMLSQQTTKALLLATAPNASSDTAHQEFNEAFGLFRRTLNAFAEGGDTLGGDGNPLRLDKVGDAGAPAVETARKLIAPVEGIAFQAAQPRADASELSLAADYMVRHNREILDLMNTLTSVLEQESVRRTHELRAIQTGAFVLALANFLLIIFGMLDKYRSVEADSRRWREMARHDPLTGIANRKAFVEAAEGILSRARIDSQAGTLLLLDLDGFKPINDSFGHLAGDQILISLADSFESAARATDIVARIGGDEFVMLCPALQGNRDIALFCERIIASVVAVPGNDFPSCRLGISIGVSCYPDNGYDLNHLLALADQAMYKAKGAGGNRWHTA
ncbi:MAG: diguanylate cyclase [Rhodocyclaceae bacterium]|nr:MAG: diguanylate cyclase [Rhodocyclaceae bacterium]